MPYRFSVNLPLYGIREDEIFCDFPAFGNCHTNTKHCLGYICTTSLYTPILRSRLVPKTAAQISLRFYILKLTFPSHMAYGQEDTVLRRFIGIPYDQSDMPFR